MKYLHSYKIFESVLYLSPEFRKTLSRFANQDSENGTPENIAYNLLLVELTDVKPDTTFVDQTKTSNVSFIQMKNAKKLLGETLPDIDKLTKSNVNSLYTSVFNDVFTKSRNEIKIGKLVKSIFSDKYSDKQIEQFVNKYKSILEQPSEVFEIVSGDDIAKWYKHDNYLELKGTMGSSCMRNMSDKTFKIYTHNPEVCQMLILRNIDENKIIGRALIWTLSNSTNNVTKLLDRIYTIKDSDIIKFQDKAKEMNIPTKWTQSYDSVKYINLDGVKTKEHMEVQLKPITEKEFDYRVYPYVDTFRQYDYTTGILYNSDDESDGCYLLDSTSGGYSVPNNEDEDEEGMVYSEYHDQMIHEDDAVYSDHLETYIRRSIAVHVNTGNRRNFGWYPRTEDDIVKDDWSGEYIHIDDSVYSEVLDKTMLADDSVNIIDEIDYVGNISSEGIFHQSDEDKEWIPMGDVDKRLWYKWIEQNNRYLDNYNGIYAGLLEKDVNGEWMLKHETYDVYLNKENDVYLNIQDARLLKLDVTKDSITMCRFDYYKILSDKGLFNRIRELLINEDKRLKHIMSKKITTMDLGEEINTEYEKIIAVKQKIVSSLIENLEEFVNL